MKYKTKKIVILSFSILTAVIITATGYITPYSYVNAAAINDSNVQSLESEISQLQTQQSEILSKIESLENKESQTAQYKQYMDSLVTATAQKIILSEQLISELDTKIADTETKIEEANKNIAETKEKFIERLRYAQENGSVSELELLLDSEGIGDFLTRLDKVSAMMEYDKEVMNEYSKQKAELDTYKETLEASKQTQAQTKEQLEVDKVTYQSTSDENAAYLQSLALDKEEYEKQYQAARAAEDALNAELSAYIQKMQEQNQVVYSGDGFMRPLPSGVGYISSHFGWRNLNGYDDYHQATDIACAQGTSIFASNSGVVLRAEFHSSYGNYVLIDHGNGISTLYAHCSALAVSAGQTVSKGDVVGYVGQTGFAFGNHLHFEYRINGQRTDPEAYVAI